MICCCHAHHHLKYSRKCHFNIFFNYYSQEFSYERNPRTNGNQFLYTWTNHMARLDESGPLTLHTKGEQLEGNWGTPRYMVNYLNRSILDAPLDDFIWLSIIQSLHKFQFRVISCLLADQNLPHFPSKFDDLGFFSLK